MSEKWVAGIEGQWGSTKLDEGGASPEMAWKARLPLADLSQAFLTHLSRFPGFLGHSWQSFPHYSLVSTCYVSGRHQAQSRISSKAPLHCTGFNLEMEIRQPRRARDRDWQKEQREGERTERGRERQETQRGRKGTQRENNRRGQRNREGTTIDSGKTTRDRDREVRDKGEGETEMLGKRDPLLSARATHT